MKIIQSIETIYDEQAAIAAIVKERVDKVLGDNKKPAWHYISRVKQKESYALKLETGRVDNPKLMEDFFACTLVVENASKVAEAKQLIEANFTIAYQRPREAEITHKSPDSFQFDDLRLYAKLIRQEHETEGPIFEMVFEIQIKTFLQHAWSIATHDLIYKSDELSWPKARVAFQVKAMLEQAEATISAVQHLSEMPELKKSTASYNEQIKIVEFLKAAFANDDLPADIVRLADTVNNLLKSLGMTLDEVKSALDAESKVGRGVITKNLSPYITIVQSLINQSPQKLAKYVNSRNGLKFKVLVPQELDIKNLTLAVGKVVRL